MTSLYVYDSPLDMDTKLRCMNLFCEQGGEWWHPEIALVAQRDDGPELKVYVRNAENCAECGQPGEETA